jgi:DNA adenine methylase
LVRSYAAATESVFLYLDPPYFVKGERLYQSAYTLHDHSEVAALIADLAHPWVVSYDAVPEITRLYKGVPSRRYRLQYSASVRQSGREVMFFSPLLRIPRQLPPRISQAAVSRAVGGSGV